MNQLVGRVDQETPQGTKTYEATRIYYPLHPGNAVEFDEASTGARMVCFGTLRVTHLQTSTTPAPRWTHAYYLFWLGWLGIVCATALGVAWMMTR